MIVTCRLRPAAAPRTWVPSLVRGALGRRKHFLDLSDGEATWRIHCQPGTTRCFLQEESSESGIHWDSSHPPIKAASPEVIVRMGHLGVQYSGHFKDLVGTLYILQGFSQ